VFCQNDIRAVIEAGDVAACSDPYLYMLLESFADTVNGQIQSGLISDLMERYLRISRLLEEKNRQLQRSNEIRREAQRIAMLGNWEYDFVTGVLDWSQTMYDILELDPSVQPTRELYYSRVHPDDLQMFLQMVDQLNNGVLSSDMVYRMVMDDDRIKWIHVRHRMKYNVQGEAVSFLGTLQDVTEVKTAQEKLQAYNNHLEELVQEKVEEVASSRMETIYALVKLAESRDDDTGKHIERTSVYCKFLAEKIREHALYPQMVTEKFIDTIALASPLHDIGKVGIPDAILLKPGRLTAEEYEVMKTHVIIGYNTLAGLQKQYPANTFFSFGMDIARYHHERWDGNGYMEGLRGEQIPLSARIMALADVYDALRSHRVYKEPYSHEKAVEIMQKGRGTHFDPKLMDLFLQYHEHFREVFDHFTR